MTRNEGALDRAVRIVFGIALLAVVLVGPAAWLAMWGALLLVTGVAGFDPVYALLGANTLREPAISYERRAIAKGK